MRTSRGGPMGVPAPQIDSFAAPHRLSTPWVGLSSWLARETPQTTPSRSPERVPAPLALGSSNVSQNATCVSPHPAVWASAGGTDTPTLATTNTVIARLRNE